MGDNASHNYCSIVIGKARVAPLKAVSIPRLELTAAVLSVGLYLFVTKEPRFAKLQLCVLDGLYSYPPMHTEQY